MSEIKPPSPANRNEQSRRRRELRDWITAIATAGAAIATAGAFVATTYFAFDAHTAARHAEENTSAHIEIALQTINGTSTIVISNRGVGAAEFVRAFCIAKIQGLPWQRFPPEVIKAHQVDVTRRLNPNASTINLQEQEGCLRTPSMADDEELYLEIEYSLPWGDRVYEEWHFSKVPRGWAEIDSPEARTLYWVPIKDLFAAMPDTVQR